MNNAKKPILICLIFCLISVLSACTNKQTVSQIVATTRPVYEFTDYLCQNTDIPVSGIVTENVSCLHDFTLQVSQMKKIEGANVLIISGLGLEDFLNSAIRHTNNIIDASQNIPTLCPEEHHGSNHNHRHEINPHIWLSPANAKIMAKNICNGLCLQYPQYTEVFSKNLESLEKKLDALEEYGQKQLSNLSCRQMLTFHDGFAYFADAFHLTILESIEEEAGSQLTSAKRIELQKLVAEHHLPAIFTEINGSNDTANAIASVTGASIYNLDMAMSNNDYFTAMYHNIDIIKEALG